MFSNSTRCAMAVAISLLTSVSFAQEYSESHLAEARKALTATKATDSFDGILLGAAAQLKQQLITGSPDKSELINATVDEEAIALAARRGALEGEAARLFASTFTDEELKSIAVFFSSSAGSKYLESTPILARELGKLARVWGAGINRDLANNVSKKLAGSGN